MTVKLKVADVKAALSTVPVSHPRRTAKACDSKIIIARERKTQIVCLSHCILDLRVVIQVQIILLGECN
jgi:hypothetical protein